MHQFIPKFTNKLAGTYGFQCSTSKNTSNYPSTASANPGIYLTPNFPTHPNPTTIIPAHQPPAHPLWPPKPSIKPQLIQKPRRVMDVVPPRPLNPQQPPPPHTAPHPPKPPVDLLLERDSRSIGAGAGLRAGGCGGVDSCCRGFLRDFVVLQAFGAIFGYVGFNEAFGVESAGK